MTTQPEALRLADELSKSHLNHHINHAAAAELRRLHEVNQELLKALDNLRSSAYWIVEGGEFSHWVNDKLMPLAAAKELSELEEMMQAARAAIAKAEGEAK
jgi:hypothetical protein